MSCESPPGSGELAVPACEALRQKLQLILREYAKNWSGSEHAQACLPEIVGDNESGGTHTFAVKLSTLQKKNHQNQINSNFVA